MDRNETHTALEKNIRAVSNPWERIPLLIGFAAIPVPANPNFAWQCAQEALHLARELNDHFWIASALHAIGRQMMVKARYSEAFHHLGQASDIFSRINEPDLMAQASLRAAMTLIFMGAFDKAMELLVKILPLFQSIGNRQGTLNTIQYLGHIHKSMGNHAKALEQYFKALDIAVEQNLEQAAAFLYADLALVYRNLEDNKRRRHYLFKALAIHKKLGNPEGMAVTTANIANHYMEEKRYAHAEKFVRQAGKLSRKLGFTAEEAMCWGQLGAISWYGGDFAKAQHYYRKGIQLAGRSENKVFRGKLYEHFGVVCLEAGKPKLAIVCMKKALQIIENSGYTQYEADVHEHLVNAYEAVGNTARALKHYREFTRIKDQFVSIGKALEAGRAEMREAIQKMDNRLKNEQTVNTELQKILERKETELVDLTLRLVQQEHHNTVRPKSKGHTQKKHPAGQTDAWETFARQFHKVHHSFYAELIKRYPQLTPTEVKVCSLIRIGLASKEIATILGVSKRTVDSHREHINKKLNISSRLAMFIAGM